MKCAQIIDLMEKIAPKEYALDWDNCGLLVGRRDKDINRIMVALDSSRNVVEQAIKQKADMLITHHPLIFSSMKSVTNDDNTGRKVFALASNDIVCYAAHTNMDASIMVDIVAKKIGLINSKILDITYSEKLYKIAVFVPRDSAENVRNAMTNEGAGYIGAYSSCTFNTEGTGTFLPLEGTNPYLGEVGKLEKADEVKIETVVTNKVMDRVIKAMLKVHPYEEVAYDIYELSNSGRQEGIGRTGYFKNEMELSRCIDIVKSEFGIKNVRYVGNLDKRIMTAAIIPGAGKSMVDMAIKSGADVFITGDMDHHTALEAYEQGMCIIDAGHFDTEHFVVEYIKEYLLKSVFSSNDKIMSDMTNLEVMIAKEEGPFRYI